MTQSRLLHTLRSPKTMKCFKTKRLSGFTLLELTVTIVIISILAAIAIPSFQGVITRAHDASAQTTLNAIARNAQALYSFDNGSTSIDWYDAFSEAVSETPVASSLNLAAQTNLTLVLDLPHSSAQELQEAQALAASITGFNQVLAGPSASASQLSIFVDNTGIVGMAIASTGNCVFGTIINRTISTWSAQRDLGADCAGSIALIDPGLVGTMPLRELSEYSNLTVPVAGQLGSPTISNSSVTFTITFTPTSSAPIDSYEISRNGSILDATVTAPLASYTDNTAVNGTSYIYAVRAQNSIGYSTSVSTTAVAAYSIPNAPAFPIVVAGDTQISIGWNAPEITSAAPISGYRLYKSTSSGPYLLAATLTPDTQLTYTDTEVSNGTTYTYQLESYGVGGTSIRSTSSAQATPITTPSQAPSLTTDTSMWAVTLSWSEVLGTAAAPVLGYKLETSADGASGWTSIYTGALLTYTHNSLISGTAYYYRVAATNSATGSLTYSSVSSATPNMLWTSGTLPTANPWRSVAYGNGVFVAITFNNTVAATSPDGLTWTARTLPSGAWWQSVTYGNGLFVALVYNSNLYATSPDGITWTEHYNMPFASWRAATFNNGVFVAVAEGGTSAATSPDGLTWTARTLPSWADWYSVTYGNGVFVAVSMGATYNRVARSTDNGATWTAATMTTTQNWSSVTYGNGLFVALSQGGSVAATSPDGIIWTNRTLPSSSEWYYIVYGNGVFVAIATDGMGGNTTAATSPDGITWTASTLPAIARWSAMTFGNGVFVAISNPNSKSAAFS